MDIKNKSLYADYKNFNFQVMAKNLKSPYVAPFFMIQSHVLVIWTQDS